MQNVDYASLSPIQQKLLAKATIAKESAYNPYSGFYVGAAILTTNQKIITGANVENAAYGSCICAERSALVTANTLGYRNYTMLAVIARPKDGFTTKVTAPCGACLQMILEFAHVSGIDTQIIMANTNLTNIAVSTIHGLLPHGFGPNDL